MTDVINAIQKIMESQIDFRKKYYAQPTSIMASKSIDSKAIEDQVLLCLYNNAMESLHIRGMMSGLSDDELEVQLDGRHQTISSARNRLVKKELVKPSGDTRPTRSGRKANVWWLTSEGFNKAKELERKANG